jgi:Flp pilus assembly protein TadD
MPVVAAGEPPGCQPVARVVSIQGSLQIQRAGETSWTFVRQLDTVVCQGDLLRTGRTGRAALLLTPETVFRVQQNSTVAIRQSADETVVEYTLGDGLQEVSRTAPNPCGAGYFITRFPKKFRVLTPFINASVEGTEFLVALSCQSATVAVYEGKVTAKQIITANSAAFALSPGEQLTAGASEPAAVKLMVKPVDAVQWALYYPPLTQAANEEVAEQACSQAEDVARGQCILQRAEQRLRVGRVEEAEADLETLSSIAPNSGEPYALRSIIRVTKNDKADALALAERATKLSPDSPRAWMALSYAYQASFDLEKASEAARQAAKVAASSSTAQARVAELLMSLGRITEAEKAAREAVSANPADARAHMVLGFVHLAQIDTKAAREDFLAAIERDSSEPLARLGLGLAIIRDGDLKAGREQIEIAVVLDPTNSLIRSYVGKAYYEENTEERDRLAQNQFALAKQLDPNDPTPWYYQAILDDAENRPAEALVNLQNSSARNDERSVYRSRLMLDQDAAARSASQAKIYNELGLSQLGLIAATTSLQQDPASAPAHRFLADVYATLPRHEIARASELLQAQLRQPLGAPPLQAQLANDFLLQSSLFGPMSIGLNEFSPLFLSDQLGLQAYGTLGNHDTYGEQIIVSGVRGPLSFSFSQLDSSTQGYRPNNDSSARQFDAFIQAQPNLSTSFQIEVTRSRGNSGDLTSTFDPTAFATNQHRDEALDTFRIGARYAIDPASDVLLSIIRQERSSSVLIDDVFFPATLGTDQDSWKAEIQYLNQANRAKLITGASHFEGRTTESVTVADFFSDQVTSSPSHNNAYGYLYFSTSPSLPEVQLGLSYDNLVSRDSGHREQWNPKLGLLWRPTPPLTLRAAAFQVLKRRINSDQGLEPTQVAGFNQYFDDANGTKSTVYGLGADLRLALNISAGIQGTARDLTVPYTQGSNVFFVAQDENQVMAYLYWLPSKRISLALQPLFQHVTNGSTFKQIDLNSLPLTARVFLPNGLSFAASLTGVWERGTFSGLNGDYQGSSNFTLVDAELDYRLPRRIGTLSVLGKNLTDTKFQFQEIDLFSQARYVPSRTILVRLSIRL